MATINSLGLGSNGVLTADIIDKLKANDNALIVTPIDNKITLQKQKGDALTLLGSLLTSFKSSVNSLDDDGLYQKRSVAGSTSSVSVTADSGVAVQTFSISDTVLAKQNVQESGTFAALDSTISTGSGTMKISIGSASYNIDYTASTTLEELKTAINSQAGSAVKASTLQVGTNDYRLVLSSVQTGLDQTITLSDSLNGTLNNSLQSYKKIESDSFGAPTDTVATGAGDLTLNLDGVSHTISYDGTTTLQNLVDSINTSAGSTVASIDSNNRLVVRSDVTGFTTPLTLTDNGGLLDPKLTAYTSYNPIEEIQAAKDASLKFNGITITRSTNEITDIAAGLTINLLQESGSANIAITQDIQSISDAMSSFVQSYNSLTSQLNSMTTTDLEAGKVGVFNGDNSINSITREINKLVTSVSSKGLSLPQFGIDISQSGTMSFNDATFKSKFNENTTESEAFLSGMTSIDSYGNSTTTAGVFTSLNAILTRYTKSGGIMSTLTEGSKSALTSLNDSRTKALALLTARYDTMSARFSQYDSMISKLTNQFSSLSQQISMAVNGTN
ncbi:MAG: flagellar filament capping protein FliD [Sulfuricurvum sp.]|nr:flagellar filament capping protein FliD [Sulfuricurvum sp.]